MIDRTFLHLPGIGEKKERRLWRDGIRTWDDYLTTDHAPGVSTTNVKAHKRLLVGLSQAWSARDLVTVAATIPAAHHWRLYRPLAQRAGFLDIETTGVWHDDSVTVVGVYEPATGTCHQLVKGRDLDAGRLVRLLARFDVLVTFNGTGFDLPMLRRHFPGVVPGTPHMDLRRPLAMLGYKGGLKKIEQALGLTRPGDVEGMTGYDAVIQWRAWSTRGDRDALDRLLSYNQEDCVQMKALAEFATSLLERQAARYWDAPGPDVVWPSGTRPAHVPFETERALTRDAVQQVSLRDGPA